MGPDSARAKWTCMKILDGFHHHCPVLLRTRVKYTNTHVCTQITLPSADAEIHVCTGSLCHAITVTLCVRMPLIIMYSISLMSSRFISSVFTFSGA